jgi:hypothetical protein
MWVSKIEMFPFFMITMILWLLNWYFWTFMGHWGLATFKMWGLASVAPAAAASFNQ